MSLGGADVIKKNWVYIVIGLCVFLVISTGGFGISSRIGFTKIRNELNRVQEESDRLREQIESTQQLNRSLRESNSRAESRIRDLEKINIELRDAISGSISDAKGITNSLDRGIRLLREAREKNDTSPVDWNTYHAGGCLYNRCPSWYQSRG